jgi:hypothetical protein
MCKEHEPFARAQHLQRHLTEVHYISPKNAKEEIDRQRRVLKEEA